MLNEGRTSRGIPWGHWCHVSRSSDKNLSVASAVEHNIPRVCAAQQRLHLRTLNITDGMQKEYGKLSSGQLQESVSVLPKLFAMLRETDAHIASAPTVRVPPAFPARQAAAHGLCEGVRGVPGAQRPRGGREA